MSEPANVRTFRGWIEDWERPLLVQNDPVAEAKLLAKYRGLRFYLPDDEVTYTIYGDNLEFQRGSKKKSLDKGCWNVFGIPPDSAILSMIFFVNLLPTLPKQSRFQGLKLSSKQRRGLLALTLITISMNKCRNERINKMLFVLYQ